MLVKLFVVLAGTIVIGLDAKPLPTVQIGLCDGVVKETDISVCCRTDNLETTDVIISYVPREQHRNPIQFGNGELPCDSAISFDDPLGNNTANFTCTRAGGVKIYNIRVPYSESYLHGNWTCESYAGSSQFSIDYAADRHDGIVTALSGMPVNLTWRMSGTPGDNYTVLAPDGSEICHLTGTSPSGTHSATCTQTGVDPSHVLVTLMMSNTSRVDGGRYTCYKGTTQNYVSYTILTLISPPSLPVIIAMDAETVYSDSPDRGDKTSVPVYCLSESRVSSSLSYVPAVTIDWKLPSSSCTTGIPRCDVTGIDCSVYDRSLIGCMAYEDTPIGRMTTDSQWVPIQDFCQTGGRFYSQTEDSSLLLTWLIILLILLYVVAYTALNIIRARRIRGLSACCCRCRSPRRFGQRFLGILRRGCCRNEQRTLQMLLPGQESYGSINRNSDISGVVGAAVYAGYANPVEATRQADRVQRQGAGAVRRSIGLAERGDNQVQNGNNTHDTAVDVTGDVAAQFNHASEARFRLWYLNMNLRNPPEHIRVKRSQLVDDVMGFYSEQPDTIASKNILVSFIDEPGLDAGGVMRDMFTTFWQEASKTFFDGNIAFVPKYDMQHHEINQFTVLGRVFAHSTACLNAIPIQICRCTLLSIIFGEMPDVESVQDIVVEDFLLYVDIRDRMVLQIALRDFENLTPEQIDLVRDIFARYEMGKIPRRGSFKQDLSRIAYNELCVKPKMACEHMARGIPQVQRWGFWCQLTLLHIDSLYESFKPTPQQVMGKLRCSQSRVLRGSDEQASFDNLKRFILNLTPELLSCFLHFVTGERKVPFRPILVNFTNAEGLARHPSANTCGNVLNLPKSYTVYKELASDFTAILTSREGLCFSMH